MLRPFAVFEMHFFQDSKWEISLSCLEDYSLHGSLLQAFIKMTYIQPIREGGRSTLLHFCDSHETSSYCEFASFHAAIQQ